MTKVAIVIQGPSSYVEELRQAWEGFDIIWSTWRGEESKYNNNDVVVFNNPPADSGVGNVACQRITTLEGVKKAKELGYTHVLKWRSDMLPSNSKRLLELFDADTLNFLAWHSDGYFVDYFLYGPIQDVALAWDFNNNIGAFAEQLLTENVLNHLFSEFYFFVHGLSTDVDILWAKYGVSLMSYQQHPCYATAKLNKQQYEK
jgi:hypothetical protein